MIDMIETKACGYQLDCCKGLGRFPHGGLRQWDSLFFCTVPTTVFALLLIFSDLCAVQYVYTGYIYKYIYIYIHTYIVIQMGRIRDEKRRRKKIKKEKV